MKESLVAMVLLLLLSCGDNTRTSNDGHTPVIVSFTVFPRTTSNSSTVNYKIDYRDEDGDVTKLFLTIFCGGKYSPDFLSVGGENDNFKEKEGIYTWNTPLICSSNYVDYYAVLVDSKNNRSNVAHSSITIN